MKKKETLNDIFYEKKIFFISSSCEPTVMEPDMSGVIDAVQMEQIVQQDTNMLVTLEPE